MGMSIHDEAKNSNIFMNPVSEKLVIATVFVSAVLLSFALGRISAFSEFNPEKTDIIMTNIEKHYDSN